MLKRLAAATLLAGLLWAPAALADGYSDKYMTMSDRLKQLDRAYQAGKAAGSDDEPQVIYRDEDREVLQMPVLDADDRVTADPCCQRPEPVTPKADICCQAVAPAIAAPPAPTYAMPSVTNPVPFGFAPVTSSGNDIPARSSLPQIVPPGGCWVMKVQPEVSQVPLSWSGNGQAWKDVVERAAARAGLAVVIDPDRCVVALAHNLAGARALASGGTVFQLIPGEWLSENLTRWASEAGWTLHWGLGQFDYRITAPATFTGPFAGEGGVLDRVATYYAEAGKPFKPVFAYDNKQVLIQSSGYTQGDGL